MWRPLTNASISAYLISSFFQACDLQHNEDLIIVDIDFRRLRGTHRVLDSQAMQPEAFLQDGEVAVERVEHFNPDESLSPRAAACWRRAPRARSPYRPERSPLSPHSYTPTLVRSLTSAVCIFELIDAEVGLNGPSRARDSVGITADAEAHVDCTMVLVDHVGVELGLTRARSIPWCNRFDCAPLL